MIPARRRCTPADQEATAPGRPDRVPRPKNPLRWLWAVLAAGAFWFAFDMGFPQLSAVASGARAVATVDGTLDSHRGPDEVRLHYTTAEGTEQQTTTAARAYLPGSQVPIYYDARHPERIRIVGDRAGPFWIVFMLGAGGFFLWGATAKPLD